VGAQETAALQPRKLIEERLMNAALEENLQNGLNQSRWQKYRSWMTLLLQAMDYEESEHNSAVVRQSAEDIRRLETRILKLESQNEALGTAVKAIK
jgi:hypothetical protein